MADDLECLNFSFLLKSRALNVKNLPERAPKACCHWEHGYILWFMESPIVRSKSPC